MGCRKGYENDTGSARPQQAVKTKLIITKKERSGYERGNKVQEENRRGEPNLEETREKSPR